MADAEPAVSPADATITEPRRPPPWPTWTDLLEWVLPDRRRMLSAVAAVLVLLGTGLTGYVLLRTPPAPATELTLPFAGTPGDGGGPSEPAPSTTAVAAELLVHAAGAVAVPGVHPVTAGSRVADLLTAAGGPLPDTDLDRVNLAAALRDGERVWFPRVGEEAPPAVSGGGSAGGGGGGGDSNPSGLVDINTASAEELDTLPGVGPSIAAAIIEHRDRNGPFASVEELLDVPGIGDAKLAQLRDRVTV